MAALSDVFDPARDRRVVDRRGAVMSATVDEWQCEPVNLLEISSGGFRAMTGRCPEVGETITAAIPALGPMIARVKWAEGQVFGAEFTNPADLRLLFLGGPVAIRTTWIERLAA